MTILLAWLLADLFGGLIHFVEDRLLLGNSRFQLLNQIAADNALHHMRPTEMLKYSLWDNTRISAMLAWPISIFLLAIGAPTVLWLMFFFAAFANVVHRYAHTPRIRRPKLVSFMQWTGLFCTFDHHAAHHFDDNGRIKKEDSRIRYCPMTNWLNPILDRIGLWWLLSKLFCCTPNQNR